MPKQANYAYLRQLITRMSINQSTKSSNNTGESLENLFVAIWQDPTHLTKSCSSSPLTKREM